MMFLLKDDPQPASIVKNAVPSNNATFLIVAVNFARDTAPAPTPPWEGSERKRENYHTKNSPMRLVADPPSHHFQRLVYHDEGIGINSSNQLFEPG